MTLGLVVKTKLHAAIDRAQLFMRKYPDSWLWRADITKLLTL